MKKTFLLFVLALVVSPISAFASGHDGKVQAYMQAEVSKWIGAKELVDAVAQQNIDHFGITENEIERLDQRWRKERNLGGGSLVSSVMGNDLSAWLRGIKAASGGVITEIFVMDNVGLNVGQTNGTGDFMQGDEAKWQKTYLVGPGEIFIDGVEEDGGVMVSQASITINRDNGYRLGAATIGINIDALK
ncbi:hypothetical protein N9K58_04190 [Alphaproteobacteria bacterium]|nr:hypothetical protein [Alphaproteobacteria bacterium]MDC6455325.1 hypothetical protein [Alphaproteobacteria bacterium]